LQKSGNPLRKEAKVLYFGLGIGGLLFLIGLATYFFAPRVGPNPIFGVRVGYSYASREVWDRTNRFGGIVMALIGLAVALLAPLLQLLGVAARDGFVLLTALMMAALVGGTAWMFVYARRLASGTAIARELASVRFHWVYVVPVLASFVLLVAVATYFYPLLPAARMATHFDLNDQPDGWMSRDGFFVTYIGLAALFVVLDALAVLVATREPLIAFSRWGSTWRLDPERGLIYSGLALAIVNVIFIALLFDVAAFNLRGEHLFPLSTFFWMIVPLIALLIALFFILARREPETSR
jgi:uncharacterized membrane protein